ncbi:MAG: hypothetical protein Q9187_004067 [Circinaria calcarea]
MAPSSRPTNGITPALTEKSYFEQQRDALVGEIAIVRPSSALSFEQVLQNINKLNRSLEGVIAVGNEFGSVEALWSQFENVMARGPDAEEEGKDGEKGEEDEVKEEEEDGGKLEGGRV